MGRSSAADTTGHLWIEEGEQQVGMVAEVAPIVRFHRTLTYGVPTRLESSIELGQRVEVPLGRRGRSVRGFVVGLDRRPWDHTLRPIKSVVDEASYLTPDLIELAREIATHYACPLGQALKAVTPEGVRRQRGFKTVRHAKLARDIDDTREDGLRLTAKRRALIDSLRASAEPLRVSFLLTQTGASAAVLRALVSAGRVEILTRREVNEQPESIVPLVEPDFVLNDEQQEALTRIHEAIDALRFSVTMLMGVSGSGKTELYVHAIRRAIAHGGQAILLVPEIVLTTQLGQRLAGRFREVALNHSGLSESHRSLMWRQVAAGIKKVIIGTRSAVFAPCPKLRLICVDEEQESSFKNLQAPRFHVRDVAIMRARQLGVPVLLGSATPSVETWYLSGRHPDYRRVVIRRRVRNLPMPEVRIVDMREEFAEVKQHVVLSRLMERLLARTLEGGAQALILMNRRGYATSVFCPACRTRLTCPNCSVGLVVHTTTGQSMCHYCCRRMATPTHCPIVTCGASLVVLGLGTQRVEQVLRQRFRSARIRRIDSDTMKHRSHYQQMIDDFEARDIDILVGTQMIAKGLDFPFVSFVGVMQADVASVSADFRADERLFQLVAQVAGRAGRADAPGQVVVQTSMPELPALRCALTHDYESFAAGELEARQKAAWPPFRRLAQIVLAHKREEIAVKESEAMGNRIRAVIDALRLDRADVLGPNACVLARLRGRYRYELVVRTLGASDLRRLLAELETHGALRARTDSVVVDVDPVSLT